MKIPLTAALLLVTISAAADEVSDSRVLQRAALQAHEARNEPLFLERTLAAYALRPQHPALVYLAAVAYAVNDRTEEALQQLERLASMGFLYAPEKEEELAPLRTNARFQAVVARFAANARAHGSPALAFSPGEGGLIPEGLAHDAATGRFFVSSVRKNTIFAIDRRGHSTPFASKLPLSVFGMAVDSKRRVLWAATSAVAQSETFAAADKDRAALLRFDLASGRLLSTIRPADSAKHIFGDVTIAPDGTAYVSDGASATILRVDGETLVPFLTGPFSSLQGLAITSDGRRMYAADYSRGLYAIDMATADFHPVSVPAQVSLLGIDGLYVAGPRTLLATQNGTNPNRIVRLQLAKGGLQVQSLEVLAANHPTLADPTLGVVVGRRFYFNANAQWDAWTVEGKLQPDAKLQPARVVRVNF